MKLKLKLKLVGVRRSTGEYKKEVAKGEKADQD
jgi:hypothetical protein